MNPKLFCLITAILLVFIPSAEAQQASKVPRIGLLAGGRQTSYLEAFRQRMRDLGYIEGQNIGIEVRYAEASADRASDIAAEFVRLKVDLILSVGTQATLIVRKATSTYCCHRGGRSSRCRPRCQSRPTGRQRHWND